MNNSRSRGAFALFWITSLILILSAQATTPTTTINDSGITTTTVYCSTITNPSGYVQLYKLLVENGSSFPSVTSSGYLFFRTDYNLLCFYNGTAWTNCTGMGGSTFPDTYPYANLTGVPQTFPYTNLTGSPDLTVYLLTSSASNFLFQNGTRSLTADWNAGAYGIYGCTWLNSTSLNALGFYWNGLNRTDALANPFQQYAYIVDFDGTTVTVKNCSTGQIDYGNTNQTLTVQWAFTHLNNGSKGTEKVLLRGNFTLNYYPQVPPYADIEVQGYLNAVSKAAFMICFDDTLYIQYSTYFKNMTTKWGYRGNEGVVPQWVINAGATNTSYITLTNLKEMRDAGWSFFSHGYNSTACHTANIAVNDQELRLSKAWIEANLGVRIDAFAWPTAYSGDLEMARQYYSYLWHSRTKSWPNQTWAYNTELLNTYFPDETNYNGTKAAGGVIAAAAWYAVNSTGGGSNGELALLTFHGTMTSAVFDLCMGNVSSWGLPVLTVRDLNYYLNKQPKPTISGTDFHLQNATTQTSCINGTWIKHNLGVIPNATFLTIYGDAYINSSCYVLQPTVISINATYFQIGFYIDNAGVITAVAVADARSIYWICTYDCIKVYPTTS